jgi:hypothetical protein
MPSKPTVFERKNKNNIDFYHTALVFLANLLGHYSAMKKKTGRYSQPVSVIS